MNYFDRGIDFTIEKLYEFSAACENWIIDFKFEKKTNKFGYRYFIPMDEFLDIYKKTAYKSELSSYYGRFLFSDYERLMKEMALWKHKPFAFNTFNTVFLPDDMINGAFAILEGLADNRMLMSLGNIPGLKITDKMGAI
jgi:hypothetical protein